MTVVSCIADGFRIIDFVCKLATWSPDRPGRGPERVGKTLLLVRVIQNFPARPGSWPVVPSSGGGGVP